MLPSNLWHTKTLPEIFEALRSNEHGLNKEEAQRRLQEYGENKLPEAKADRLAVIFLRQFKSPLIYTLIAASVIIFVIGEFIDGSVILFVLFFNAVVGTIQEGKAQNTLLTLKKLVETSAVILREGREFIIPDNEIVPGDVVIIQEGDKVPADGRIIISNNIKVDEASLTGESIPIHKLSEIVGKNMIFKGTHVVAGNGKALIVATGLNTAIGRISKEIAAIDKEIPLNKDVRYLSRIIIAVVTIISSGLFSLGILLGKSIKEMFTTVVSLSVSIIPEGLPIVITLVLATGVWRMSKKNALVKRLQAVEALGQARVIAVDKTGTVTKNEMTVQKVYADGKIFDIKGIGYEPKGEIILEGKVIDPLNHQELLMAGKIAAFCANARTIFLENKNEWLASGDPTETALFVFAEKIGFHKDDLERESPKTTDIPFDYKTKYHATVHKINNKSLLAVVGAPEIILDLSTKIWARNKENHLSEKKKKELESIFSNFSQEGLRVLAFSLREITADFNPKDIEKLSFVGFFGMKDGLRPDVYEAVKKAISADIRVVMITGDNAITAKAIAKEAKIWEEGDEILTGDDIDNLSSDELSKKLNKTSIFARVTPEHKLKIVQAYKKMGEIVAMTGDGVNDAPSLVAADLGVAMGKIGTEVAKEAADIILLDDNFGNIVLAVEEGRNIYKTLKKVILYLFSTSLGEVLTIAGALTLGYPLPLLAAQIIWLNLVTDGFLDVALAMEPKEKGLLRGTFERPKKYFVDSLMVQRMFVMAIPMAIGTLWLFQGYYETNLMKAWTVSLTVLAVFQWFNAWNCRHDKESLFSLNPFSNKFLIFATAIVITLQFFAIYHPLMQKILRTTSLSLLDWTFIIPVAISIIFAEELRKLIYRRYIKRNAL